MVAIADLYWLTFARAPSTAVLGAQAAAGWLLGRASGPVTGRAEQPVGKRLAITEMWAASSGVGDGPAAPLEMVCAQQRVAYVEPVPVSSEWAHGVWVTLRWATCTGGQRAPLQLPARDVWGRVLGAEELLEKARAAQPHREWLPEQVAETRAAAEQAAARSARLAAIVEEMRFRHAS